MEVGSGYEGGFESILSEGYFISVPYCRYLREWPNSLENAFVDASKFTPLKYSQKSPTSDSQIFSMNGRGWVRSKYKGRGRSDFPAAAATGTATATAAASELPYTVYGGRKGNCNYCKQPGHYKNECKKLHGNAAEPLQTPEHPSKNKVSFYPQERHSKK